MGQLKNKNAIITGAASGIGQAAARCFADEGANLILADIQSMDETMALLDGAGSAIAIQGDASDPTHVENLVKTCISEHGGLHVFFANAGIGGNFVPLLEESFEDWQKTLQINTIGPFLAVRHAAPKMIEGGGGSIIITASVAGIRAGAGPSAYSASKAAAMSLAQTAACQLATSGVRVNAICPGLIETGMTKPIFDYVRAAGKADRLGNKCPMQRPAQPPEVAQMAMFLASDAASYVTGQAIAVDGGLTATHPFKPGQFI